MRSDSSRPEASSTPPASSDPAETTPSAAEILDRDRRLVEAWRGGDVDRGEDLMALYHRYFLSLCWRYGIVQEDDQLDLYQEMLIRLMRVLPKLDLKRSFAGYLRRVFHTAVRETRSSEHVAPIHEGLVDDGPGPDHAVRDEEIVAAIEECSDGLNGRERSVFVARIIEERGFTDIASAQGVSIGNLHVIYHRARSKMRRCLEEKGFRV